MAQVPPSLTGRNTDSCKQAAETNCPPPELPIFHSESRQVLIGATVWRDADKSSVPEVPRFGPADSRAQDLSKLLPIPVRGLTAKDFHVFENGVEQNVNYLIEADFLAYARASRWVFNPRPRGTWAYLPSPMQMEVGTGEATYLIGYVPRALQPGECRTIKAIVEGRYVYLNRGQYCAKDSDTLDRALLESTELGTRMRKFATSSERGSIKVSTRAFVFRSKGLLQLGKATSAIEDAPAFAPPEYKFVVDVHDSKAPATVHIATEFNPSKYWEYPKCVKNQQALHVLGIVYKKDGEIAGQFGDSATCGSDDPGAFKNAMKVVMGIIIPNRFDTQIELSPGEYELVVVVADEKYNFGRARLPLRVERFDGNRLTLSDLVVTNISRDASEMLDELADIAPAPLVPTPLVSKDTQYTPSLSARVQEHSFLSLYLEIYEPLLENKETADTTVYLRVRVTDLRTGAVVVNTGPISAAKWVQSGNAVIPIGTKLATDTLKKGSYKLEVQASDSAGRETEWHQATFEVSNDSCTILGCP